jgi:hypothetical protein
MRERARERERACARARAREYSSRGAWMQVLERWNFDIETDGSSVQKPDMEHEKSEKVRLAKISCFACLSLPPP